MMRDFAQDIVLTDAGIDKEKYAVIEEARRTPGARYRLDRFWPEITDNMPCAHKAFRTSPERLTGIENINHAALIRFYKDWYRPNIQSLTVVGQIDPKIISSKITDLFSDMKNPANERPVRGDCKIDLSGKNKFISHTRSGISLI